MRPYPGRGRPSHVTLLFIPPGSGPSLVRSRLVIDLEVFESELVNVTIRGLAWNARVACLLVSLPENFPCATPYPHITLALARGT